MSISALLLAMPFAIAGCGGSKSSSTASTTGPPPGAPPGATRLGPGGPPGSAPAGSQSTRGIGALVLQKGELAGFTAPGGVQTAIVPRAFVAIQGVPPDQAQKETARLVKAGFAAGAVEHLMSSGGAEGLSFTEQFRTAKAARAEIAHGLIPQAGVTQTNFAVAGIPGARGFDASSGQGSGHNIAFVVGTHYYLVGVGAQRGTPNLPSRATLVAAAKHLYARVHG